MQCLSIQLDPRRNNEYTPEDLVQRAKDLGRYPEIDRDGAHAPYINLNFFTEDITALWSEFSEHLMNAPGLGDWLKQTAVIVSENTENTGEFVVLWHYDQTITDQE